MFSLGTTASSKIELARVAGPPAHLVFLLAGPEAADPAADSASWPTPSAAAPLEVTGLLGQDEAGDPLVAVARLGAGGDDEDLAHAGVGDEDLGTVEQVVVALVHRGGGGAAGVAAGARLGEPEPAQHLARGEQRDVAPLLCLGAELHDRRGAEVGMGADGQGVAGIHLGQLVDRDVVGELVHPGPAQLLGPRDAEQPEVAHPLDVVPGEGGGAVELAGHRGDMRCRRNRAPCRGPGSAARRSRGRDP